jgi:hypothetical protein
MAHALRGGALAAPWAAAAAAGGGLSEDMAEAYARSWRAAFLRSTGRARLLGRLLEHPRLSGLVVGGLERLGTRGEAAFARLVAGTRTGRVAPAGEAWG